MNDLAVDCIDRQATLDAIIKRLGIRNETYLLEAERVIYQQILAMPSVAPQPRKGHWIRVDKDKLRCSECDVIHFIAQYPQGKIAWCPNCGSRNEVKE